MSNVIEDRGFFWWWDFDAKSENSSNSPVSGLLTIDDKGQIKLRLDHELPGDGLPRPLMDKARPFPQASMIAGELSKSGEFVLLDSLRLTSWVSSAAPMRPRSYTADTCLVGHIPIEPSVDVLQFRALRIKLEGLEDWLNLAAINSAMVDCEEGGLEFSIKYRPQRFETKTGDSCLFVETITSNPSLFMDLSPYSEVTFRQESWLQYERRSESGITSIQEDFTRLEELFAILTGSYFQLDWPFAIQGSESDERWYRLYFFRGSSSDYKPDLSNTLTWFYWSRDSLGRLFENLKMRRQEYGPGYYLYLAALRNPSVYVEHKFVNLIWALESLHRRKNPPTTTQTPEKVLRILDKFREPADRKDLKWLEGRLKFADEASLENRIVQSFMHLPFDIPPTALRNFAKRCADRRNEISHKGGPSSDELYSEFHQDLIYLSEALKYLYHALLLDEIGFDKARLKEAFTSTFIARSRILPVLQVLGLVIEPISAAVPDAQLPGE